MLVDALDRREPDFRRIAAFELRAQRGGDDLMAQAHAQYRLADADCRPCELAFRFESRIFVEVERAHRPAHDHHAGNLFEIRQIRLLFLRDVRDFVRHTQVVQAIQNAPRFLPRDMLKNQHFRLRHTTIVTSPT